MAEVGRQERREALRRLANSGDLRRWTARDLAEAYGVGVVQIRRDLRAIRASSRARHGMTRHPWHEVDWENERTTEIATRFGVAPQYVSLMRRRYAPHTLTHVQIHDPRRTRS